MKIRLVERLLAALAGLIMILQGLVYALCAFGILPAALQTLANQGFFIRLALGVGFVLLGVFLLGLLFRRSYGRKGFVLQNTENGELSISIKAMESLVQKCVDKHDELKVLSTDISNGREGVVVSMRISLANGISIPLAVNSLQKQIKQYITACSGVDVQEVRVQVETTTAEAEDSPYAVPEADITFEKEPEPPEAAKLPVMAEPEKQEPVQVPEPDAEEAKRPLHQRLFSHQEEEATVPVPPATEAAENEEVNQTTEAQEEEATDETV